MLVLKLGSTVADDCNLFVFLGWVGSYFFIVLQRNCKKLKQILVKKKKKMDCNGMESKVHTYIIGHYNPSVRIIDLLLIAIGLKKSRLIAR